MGSCVDTFSPTSSPTQDCESGVTNLKIEIKTDLYEDENYWKIFDVKNSLSEFLFTCEEDFWTGHCFDSANTTYIENLTLCDGREYMFCMFDEAEDGIEPPGYYKLTLGEKVVASGGDFEVQQECTTFCQNCLTSTPTSSYSPTTVPIIMDGKECSQSINLGKEFDNPKECAEVALTDERCNGYQIMWSSGYYDKWGCRCCTKPVQCGIDDFYSNHPQWASHQFRECPTAPSFTPTSSSGPTANAFPIIDGKECSQSINLGTEFDNPKECAEVALTDERCNGYQIMWSSGYYDQWGCRCCTKPVQCGIDDFYSNHPQWALHQFRECPTAPSSTPTSSSGPTANVFKIIEGKQCSQNINLGTEFDNPEECAEAALTDERCNG